MAALLAGTPGAVVKRAREDFVVHFPHYDNDVLGPAAALLLGNDKLIRPYETGAVLLFDLSSDLSERHDLARDRVKDTADLDRRLSEYLKAIGAQMPTPNPKFDPTQPRSSPERREGGRRRPE
jgi:hypothetical protein